MSEVKNSTLNKQLTNIQKELNSAISNASSTDSKKNNKVKGDTQDIIEKIDKSSLSDSAKEKLLGTAESLNSMADDGSTKGSGWDDATSKMSDLINSVGPNPEAYTPKSSKDQTKFDQDDIQKAYDKVTSDVGKGNSLGVGKLKQDIQNLMDRVNYSDLTKIQKDGLTKVVKSMMDVAGQSGKADTWNTALKQMDGFFNGTINFNDPDPVQPAKTYTASDISSALTTATQGGVTSDNAQENAQNLLNAINNATDLSEDAQNTLITAGYSMLSAAGESWEQSKWDTAAQTIKNTLSGSSSTAASDSNADAPAALSLSDAAKAVESIDPSDSSAADKVQQLLASIGNNTNISGSDRDSLTTAAYSLLAATPLSSSDRPADPDKWNAGLSTLKGILSNYSSSSLSNTTGAGSSADNGNSTSTSSDNGNQDTYIIPGFNG